MFLSMSILDHHSLHFLDELPENAEGLEAASFLRKVLGPEQALAATEQHSLRRKAFLQRGNRDFKLLTRKGLEQATHPMVAAWRARELSKISPGGSFWDATCGLGADSIALAQAGMTVVSSDLDTRTAHCAAYNLSEAEGLTGNTLVLSCDATEGAVKASGMLIDPDRRTAGRRRLNPAAWSPSLDQCLKLLGQVEIGCVKLAPALEPNEEILSQGTLCWVSLERELKEVTLFTGLARAESPERRVVALSLDGGKATLAGVPITLAPMDPGKVGDIGWLANPDPALLRSGLLEFEAKRHGMLPLAPQLAWLGGHERPSSPFLKARQVLGSTQADPRRVRKMLAEHDVGPLEIWKRGHPDPAEVLARRFRGRGSRRAILAIGRLEQGHQAWLLDLNPGPSA